MKRREQNDLTFISGDVTLYMYYYTVHSLLFVRGDDGRGNGKGNVK